MSERPSGEQAMTTWADAQQQMLATWLDAWRGDDGQADGTAWRRSVEAWHTSVKAAMEAQNWWIHRWTDALTSSPATPEPIRAWAQLSVRQLDYWTHTQETIWENWLDRVKDVQPASSPSQAQQEERQMTPARSVEGVESGQGVIQFWQAWMREMLDMQAEWTRRWMEIAGTR